MTVQIFNLLTINVSQFNEFEYRIIYIQKLTNRKREEKSSQESVRHPVVICIATGGETSDKNKVTTKQCKGMCKVNEEKFNHAKRVLQRKKE